MDRSKFLILNQYFLYSSSVEEETMAFAYDGVVFTPGNGSAGSKPVDIELTLGGNAITSGTFMIPLIGVSDLDLDEDTRIWAAADWEEYQLYVDNAGGAKTFELDSYLRYIFFVADSGHCKVTISLVSGQSSDGNIYLIVPLPSGALAISDAITVNGIPPG